MTVSLLRAEVPLQMPATPLLNGTSDSAVQPQNYSLNGFTCELSKFLIIRYGEISVTLGATRGIYDKNVYFSLCLFMVLNYGITQ